MNVSQQLPLEVQDSKKIMNAVCFMTHIFYFLSYDEEDSHCFLMEAKAVFPETEN